MWRWFFALRAEGPTETGATGSDGVSPPAAKLQGATRPPSRLEGCLGPRLPERAENWPHHQDGAARSARTLSSAPDPHNSLAMAKGGRERDHGTAFPRRGLPCRRRFQCVREPPAMCLITAMPAEKRQRDCQRRKPHTVRQAQRDRSPSPPLAAPCFLQVRRCRSSQLPGETHAFQFWPCG